MPIKYWVKCCPCQWRLYHFGNNIFKMNVHFRALAVCRWGIWFQIFLWFSYWHNLYLNSHIYIISGKYHGICFATSDVSVFTLNPLLNCEKVPLLQSWMFVAFVLDIWYSVICSIRSVYRYWWWYEEKHVNKYGTLWNCMFSRAQILSCTVNSVSTTAVCCPSLCYNSKHKQPWLLNP